MLNKKSKVFKDYKDIFKAFNTLSFRVYQV